MEGSVNLQLSAKSVGLFEAFYNSLKVRLICPSSAKHYSCFSNIFSLFPRSLYQPIQLINYSLDVAKPGKLPHGRTEIPFEIPLKTKGNKSLYETYHGVFVNIQVRWTKAPQSAAWNYHLKLMSQMFCHISHSICHFIISKLFPIAVHAESWHETFTFEQRSPETMWIHRWIQSKSSFRSSQIIALIKACDTLQSFENYPSRNRKKRLTQSWLHSPLLQILWGMLKKSVCIQISDFLFVSDSHCIQLLFSFTVAEIHCSKLQGQRSPRFHHVSYHWAVHWRTDCWAVRCPHQVHWTPARQSWNMWMCRRLLERWWVLWIPECWTVLGSRSVRFVDHVRVGMFDWSQLLDQWAGIHIYLCCDFG